MEYLTTITISSTYNVTIEADSEEAARSIANDMPAGDVRLQGSLQDVVTSVDEVWE